MRGPRYIPPRESPPSRTEKVKNPGRRKLLIWAKHLGPMIPAAILGGVGIKLLGDELSRRAAQEEEVTVRAGEPSAEFDLATARFMHEYTRRRIGAPRTRLEEALINGRQDTIGGGGLSRIEYVRRHIGDQFTLPDDIAPELQEVIRAEVSRLAVGLAAQESKFDNSAESRMGARRIFQFMEETHEEFGYSEEDMLLLTNQVAAAGRYLSRAYRHIWTEAHEALVTIESRFFANDSVRFQREFVVPVLMNSYNAGPRRMIAAVTWFADRYKDTHSAERDLGADYGTEGFGYDIFHLLTVSVRERGRREQDVLSRYGRDASEYVARIRAFTALIEEWEAQNESR